MCAVLGLNAAFTQQPGEVGYTDVSKLPAGRVGERIQSLIAMVNANSHEVVRRFLEKECTEQFRNSAPLEQHIGAALGYFLETAGVEFHSIRTYIPERKRDTVVILKDRNFESWRAVTLRFDEGNDYLISRIAFNVASPPTNVKETPLSENEFIQSTKDLLARLDKNKVFSGTLLVAKGDKILLTHASGEASKRFHVPNNIDTKFNLGSMNKMFTSTAIVRLVEQGKISLDDPISNYVDESWLPKEVTSKITIHHLLTHTSGLGSYFNRKFSESSRELFKAVNDYKPLIKDDKPAFEPGTRYRYSNTGMFLLGVVIESVTGETYFDHIRKHIYVPTGMRDSDSYEMDYPVENLAIGYSPDWMSPYGWQNNIFKHVIKGGPAGGGFSTVKDLHRFALALLDGKYVSREFLERMWTDHSGGGYGYGFGIQEGAFGKAVGHSGGFDGINADLKIYLDKGYIVAVLSNIDRGATPLSQKISQLLGRVE